MKLFAESVTAWREKYGSDLFFRTTVNIIALQAGFVLVCVLGYVIVWAYSDHGWLVFAGIIIAAVVFGALLARYTLAPAQNTLHNQKLFISNVAHELRTPLSTIKTSSEVALLDESLAPDVRTTFTEIVEELNRISDIINNLLSLNTLTRPERMQFHNVDVGPIAEGAIQRLTSLARERGIRITLRKESNSIVWGNPGALEQIMTNIIKNALAYTPEDTNGAVTVTVRPNGDGLILFSVTDTGIGISQDDLFHIFEPFYRADTSRVRKIRRTGSGLGLTIVNEMVRAHHGKIQVQSTKRKGTTVSVYLPQGGWANREGHDEVPMDRSEASFDFSSGYTPQGPRSR